MPRLIDGPIIFLLFWQAIAHAGCSVSGASIAFGTYDIFDPLPKDSEAFLTVGCDSMVHGNPDVTIAIGPSQTSGSMTLRQMRGPGGDRLYYGLFTDASRIQPWGDGIAGGTTVTIRNLRNRTTYVRVYGRLPAGQDVSAGNYGDVVTVSITW